MNEILEEINFDSMVMTCKDYIDMEEEYGAHNYHPLDIVIHKAHGVWVEDVDNKKYLDCLSAYSAVNQGHCHPRILDALVKQANKVTLTSRAFRNDKMGFLYKKLCEISSMEKVLPMNTGAEAVETAIKAARKWGYQKKKVKNDKAEIIVCSNNFHGRTTTIVGFSSEKQYKDGFGPFAAGFVEVKFGDISALKKAITKNTVAFLFEPIQGEGGILMPAENYLREAQLLCKNNNVLFIDDEIQTGLGRTGKMFAFEHYLDEKPDMLIVGKALSGGFYPVSAILTNKQIMSVFNPGDHGSTFGGNPLACAVAVEALNVIVEEDLARKSGELGSYLMDLLKTIDSSRIKEIRGKGLFIGIELNEKARPYCEALKEEGLLCKETHDNVIRLAPPLVITKKEIDWAFDRVKKVLQA
jgi:ornithine--oxo-acid transaminase